MLGDGLWPVWLPCALLSKGARQAGDGLVEHVFGDGYELHARIWHPYRPEAVAGRPAPRGA